MAARAKLVLTVGSSRGASTLNISSSGAYISLRVNDVNVWLPRQPVQPTTSSKAFWASVLAEATAAVNALP